MELNYSPEPVESVMMHGPSDGELPPACEALKLVLVGSALASGRSKPELRLGLLDENTDRNFCLNHFLIDRSLLEGVDMAKGRLNMLLIAWEIDEAHVIRDPGYLEIMYCQ
jgi:hypothetical protein